jgi:hypothetical protein
MRPLDAAAGPPDHTGRELRIEVQHLNHWFGEGDTAKQVLTDINLSVYAGEIVILTDPSGSGKTTLLTMLGGLRAAQSGSLRVLGEELLEADNTTLTRLRRQAGFIFQAHYLLPCLTALENVRFGLEVSPVWPGKAGWRWMTAPPPCWATWDWGNGCITTPRNSPAARSSGWRSPAPWPPAPDCCWPMNPPQPSTRPPVAMWSTCSASWPTATAPRS